MSEVDVVIIGAGPAGSSASLTLTSHGPVNAMLLEKSPDSPRNLTPLTFGEVPALYGLEASVTARYSSFSYLYPGQKALLFQYKKAPFTALDYRKACGLLREKALSGSRMRQVRGEVTNLTPEAGGITVSLQDGTRIRSRFVIDASGRTHTALRALDLPFEGYYSHVLGYYLEVEEAIEEPLAVFL
jgi:flavin-dependent dehydrogenase